jgi:DNA-binding transcriptional LysR family regulator
MKIEDVAVWEAFRAVAVHGNFSKAARALRLGVPQLSKRVARLEGELGARLFRRSTRVVSLTDEGRALLPRVEALLADWAGLEAGFEDRGELSGAIRVTCVPFVAERLLIPVLAEFMRLHPRVQVELEISEGLLNLAESGIDLAIRIDEPEDGDLVYRKLAANDLVLCASPRYLKTTAAPLTSPAHLARHPLLMLGLHTGCRFRGSRLRLGELTAGRRVTCENGAFLKQLALQDFGVLVRSIWDVRDHLQRGELVQVLKKHPLDPFGNIHAVIPSRRLLAPRVRALLDLVVTRAGEWARD